jgi:hypothetical protein
MTDIKDSSAAADSEFSKKAAARVEPILKYLDTGDTIVDKEKISELFVKLWEYEGGEKLDAGTQRLTTLALFMYVSHSVLEDYNIRIDRAREHITQALHEWMKPELEHLSKRAKIILMIVLPGNISCPTLKKSTIQNGTSKLKNVGSLSFLSVLVGPITSKPPVSLIKYHGRPERITWI